MADINSELNRFNGTDNDALLLRNAIKGSTDPSTAIKGFIGQVYVNSSTGDTFVCKSASVGNYVWVRLCPDEIGAELATDLGLPSNASVRDALGLISNMSKIQHGSYVGTGGSNTIEIQVSFKPVIFILETYDNENGYRVNSLVVSINGYTYLLRDGSVSYDNSGWLSIVDNSIRISGNYLNSAGANSYYTVLGANI